MGKHANRRPEDHIEAARLVLGIKENFQALSKYLHPKVPKSHKVASRLGRLGKELDWLKCELDSLVHRDISDLGRVDTTYPQDEALRLARRVYYSQREGTEETLKELGRLLDEYRTARG